MLNIEYGFFLKYRTQFGCEEWVLRVNYYFIYIYIYIYIHTYVYIYIFIFIFGICTCSRASQLKLHFWIIIGFSPVLFISFPALLLFSCSVLSDSLRSHELQHTRLPCSSPSPGVCSLIYIEPVMPSNHLILSCPLLLPSIFPSIRVFSSEWIFISGELQFQHQSFQPIFREDLF